MNIQDLLLEDNIYAICGFLDRFSVQVFCTVLRIKPHKFRQSQIISSRDLIKRQFNIADTLFLKPEQYTMAPDDISQDTITLAQFRSCFVKIFQYHKQHHRDILRCAACYDNIELFNYMITIIEDLNIPIRWIKIKNRSILHRIQDPSIPISPWVIEAVMSGGAIELIKHLKHQKETIANYNVLDLAAIHSPEHIDLALQMNTTKTGGAYRMAIYSNNLAMMQYLFDNGFPFGYSSSYPEICVVDVNKTVRLRGSLCDFAAELDHMEILNWLFQHNLRGTELTSFHLAKNRRFDTLFSAIKDGTRYCNYTLAQLAIHNKFDLLWDIIQYKPIQSIPGHVLYHAVIHKSTIIYKLWKFTSKETRSILSIAAVETGNFALLKRIHKGYISPISYCFTTDISILQWLYDQGIRNHNLYAQYPTLDTMPTLIAAELKQLPVLEWMLRNDFPFDIGDILRAAGDKAPAIISWIRRKTDH
jgi:hypothetical protein